MSINRYSIDSFHRFNLKDLQAEISQNQEPNSSYLNQQESQPNYKCKCDVDSQINIENLGNTSNSQTIAQVNKQKLKETQNATILVAKSYRHQETEILIIFKRIYQKIVSSYLKQISSQDSKINKRNDTFQSCEFYSNLHLQIYLSAVNEIISRTQIEFSQKQELIKFFQNFLQTKNFIIQTLTKGFQQINTEFIYIIKMLLDELKQLISIQELDNVNIYPNPKEQSYKKQEILVSQSLYRLHVMGIVQKNEIDMKKLLENNKFCQKVFFNEKIKFINGRQVSLPICDQKLKQYFARFIKLYSHLIIKLISVDLIQIHLGQQKTIDKVEGQKDKFASCDIVGNWFLSNSCAKSFNSINSLTSINLNNLNEIKIYNSKPDLWSSQQQQNGDSFTDQVPFLGHKKRKI